jgi:hypothetical protein
LGREVPSPGTYYEKPDKRQAVSPQQRTSTDTEHGLIDYVENGGEYILELASTYPRWWVPLSCIPGTQVYCNYGQLLYSDQHREERNDRRLRNV